MKPITPNEVPFKKQTIIPVFVIESFDKLIIQNWNGKSSSFRQDDVIVEIIKNQPEISNLNARNIYDKRYLDIEPIYEEAGWIVEYDKPGYNESYPASFTFTKK